MDCIYYSCIIWLSDKSMLYALSTYSLMDTQLNTSSGARPHMDWGHCLLGGVVHVHVY